MTNDRWFVVAMIALWAVAGLIEPHLPNGGTPFNEVSVVQSFAMAVLLFGWCKAHARTRAIRVPAYAPLLVAIFAPIGLPYYAFRGYGLRKGSLLLAFSLFTFIGLLAAYVFCFYLSTRLGA